MLGELFTPVETPEAPNRGFFKGLFGGGAQSLDREELCKTENGFHFFYIYSTQIYDLEWGPIKQSDKECWIWMSVKGRKTPEN